MIANFRRVALLPATGLLISACAIAEAAGTPLLTEPAPSPSPAVTQQNISPLPVLFYDVSGSTFAGPAHMHMAVYANGQASISRRDQFVPADGDRVIEAAISPQAVREFQAALRRAGAGRILPPLNLNTADIPLTTAISTCRSKPPRLTA